jgi:hypothetical protein
MAYLMAPPDGAMPHPSMILLPVIWLPRHFVVVHSSTSTGQQPRKLSERRATVGSKIDRHITSVYPPSQAHWQASESTRTRSTAAPSRELPSSRLGSHWPITVAVAGTVIFFCMMTDCVCVYDRYKVASSSSGLVLPVHITSEYPSTRSPSLTATVELPSSPSWPGRPNVTASGSRRDFGRQTRHGFCMIVQALSS